MKFLPIILLLCALLGCNSASQSQEAIRQAVIDSVASKVNVGAMDVDVTSISFKGAEADATVSFRPKGSKSGGMEMRYTLEQQSGKWIVKDKAQEGGAPHGAMPNGSMPNGAMPGSGATEMPPGHPSVDPDGAKK